VKHVDLFSGIGGFAYAAQQVWGKDYENICFCDNNSFCQEVIKKNFGKDSLIYGEIRELTKEQLTADTNGNGLQKPRAELEAGGGRQLSEITLLTGGFPCQPFSQAGKRRGTGDDRYLWPEMYRVIKDFSPRWVIAENVRGLINISNGVVFEQVCLDLEAIGYEVQVFIIPAVAVNAPHRRDRVWIVANSESSRRLPRGNPSERDTEDREHLSENRQQGERQGLRFGEIDFDAPDTKSRKPREQTEQEGREDISGTNIFNPDTCDEGSEGREPDQITGHRGQPCGNGSDQKPNWNQNWIEVATKFCALDDGLSRRLVRFSDGTKMSYSKWRIEALKAAGNAIVPQVAIEIFKAIKAVEDAE
jgi:DNA (cytosine-5)-methyltransferase 1